MTRILTIILLGISAVTSSAQADELLYLFKNQRAQYQELVDERAAEYKARGQEYVDHLYATNGEESMPEPDNMFPLENLVEREKKVDIDEVAEIVKERQ